MRRERFLRILTVAGLVLLLSLQTATAAKPFEGIVHSKKTTITTMPMMGEQRQETQETVYYKPGRFKVVEPDRGSIIIVRLDKGLVWQIDQNKKTYTELTFEQIAQMREKAAAVAGDMQKQLQERLQALPEDKRQMMEQMLGQGMMKAVMEKKLELTWKTTDEKQTINGFPCRKYIPLLNGQPIGEVWVTDKYDLGQDVAKYVDALGLVGEKKIASAPPFKGLPIKTVTVVQMGPTSSRSESLVTKVEEKRVPDEEFELPPGLKKVEFQQQMMQQE